MTGIIKNITDRGFGFITREGEEKDLFFHSKDLVDVAFDSLKVGDKLNFEVVKNIVNGVEKFAAVNVTLVA